MRLVLLGAPGAGKGTQGQKLAKWLKIPEISTGELLRAAVAAKTPLGRAAKAVMDAGQLVSDEIVLGVIRERLLQADTHKGFILDGYPRNLAQAEALDELLKDIGQPLDLALVINVDTDWLLQRLAGRRSCVSCGAVYNIFTAAPKMDERCDECGGRLRQRADDHEETIGNRLRIYETYTAPVIERYREQGRLRTVQGVGSVDTVFRAVKKVIEEERAAQQKADRSAVIRHAVARQKAGKATQDSKPAAAKKKQPAKKTSAGKTSPKKTTPKKTAAKKTTAKKASGRKTTAKKATKKSASKTGSAKKRVVKKTASKKKTVAGRKSASRKAGARKAVAKKTTGKKIVSKKAGRKVATKKKTTRTKRR